MGRFSKDKLRSRGKHGAWILECQIQCCSEGYLCSLAEFLVYYHVSDIWMAFWELQRKMCNGQSINCLLGKFSPTRMIKSGSEKAWEDISELFINYHCYLFPEIGTGKLSAWVGLKTQSASCSTASNFGRPLASLWQITNQSAIFHSCLVSVLLCSRVITAYSISQHPVNDLSALLNAEISPASDELSPGLGSLHVAELGMCEGWDFPAPSMWEADC